jgi:hypothetical protein
MNVMTIYHYLCSVLFLFTPVILSAQEVNRATEIYKILNIGDNTESIEFDAKKVQTSLHYILCGSNERDLIC